MNIDINDIVKVKACDQFLVEGFVIVKEVLEVVKSEYKEKESSKKYVGDYYTNNTFIKDTIFYENDILEVYKSKESNSINNDSLNNIESVNQRIICPCCGEGFLTWKNKKDINSNGPYNEFPYCEKCNTNFEMTIDYLNLKIKIEKKFN